MPRALRCRLLVWTAHQQSCEKVMFSVVSVRQSFCPGRVFESHVTITLDAVYTSPHTHSHIHTHTHTHTHTYTHTHTKERIGKKTRYFEVVVTMNVLEMCANKNPRNWKIEFRVSNRARTPHWTGQGQIHNVWY